MDHEQVTHQQIYERLVAVEQKVDSLHEETQGMVSAFKAAAGAFIVLEWLAKVAKPLLILGAACSAVVLAVQNLRVKN
jgi:hypothetical protein